jgi:hypothetical protein
MVSLESIPSYILQSWHVTTTTGLLVIAPFFLTYVITCLSSMNGVNSKGDNLEPPPVPYTVPLLGNVFSFAFDTVGTVGSIMYISLLLMDLTNTRNIDKSMAQSPSASVLVQTQSTSSPVVPIFQPSSPNHEISPPKHSRFLL